MKPLLVVLTLTFAFAITSPIARAGDSRLDLSAEKKAAQERLDRVRQRAKESQIRCVDDAIQQIEVALLEQNKKALKSTIVSHAKSECKKVWGKMWALD